MKKIVLVLVVLLFAVPAWADVNITATQVLDTNEVIISWDASTEPNLVRAFGLNVQLDNDVNILVVTGISPDYKIFPGTIQIDVLGEITYEGTIAAEYADLPSDTLPGPPDGNGVTLEAASLYAPPANPVNAPPDHGDLASIIVSDDCWLCVSANISRAGATGVVMEAPDEVVTVNYSACIYVDINTPPDECMKESHPAYAAWDAWGKPDCWCYERQCRGDATGSKLGPYWVQLADLNILKSAYFKVDAVLAGVPNGICADFNHASLGPYRVQLADLNILKAHYFKIETLVPVCDPTHYNMPWETP